ncbi:MAG: ABC transporter permease, partial [Hyphomicrobiales bacterium]|nr:ABC transporter permease [Hyphomicrobiales bacterium]
ARQVVMQAAPSTHFISLAQAVLSRGAGLDLVWPQLAAMVGIGIVLFGIALARFRRSLTLARS